MLKSVFKNIRIYSLNIRSISNATTSFYKENNDHETRVQNRNENNSSQQPDFLKTTQLPDLLDGLTNIKKNDIEPERLSRVFSKIFDLYKDDYDIQSYKVKESQGFKNCCYLLRTHAPRMNGNDLVLCLKVLISLKINSHNKLVQQLLFHIKEEINNLTLTQLAFLNYLLSKMDKTPLVSALQIAIPIVFDLNISLKLDHENPDELQKLLQHVTSSNMKISEKSTINLISSLTLHGTSLSVNTAQSILMSLCMLNSQFFEDHNIVTEKLVQNCIHVLNTKFNESSFPRMEMTLEKLIRKFKYSNLQVFYSESFLNNCVKHLIENDLGFTTAYHVLRRLDEINFVSYNLLDYIDQQIIQNHTHLSTMKMRSLMRLISAFSTANYKSENWEIMKTLLHENPVLHDEVKVEYQLLKFISELLSLDFISKIFFDKVLDENFLVNYLEYNSVKNYVNLPQLRLINQSLKLLYPEYDGILPDKILIDVANDAITDSTRDEQMVNILEFIFGKNTIQTNVQTKHGHLLDYVISFDNQKKAIAMPCKVKYYEDLPKSQVQNIGIYFHKRRNSPINYPLKLRGIIALRNKTLDVAGIKKVDIAMHCLELLPDAEKHDYIEREIRLALE